MNQKLSNAVLAALLLFVAGRCLVPMDETDLFFNLRLGEIVLQTGRVPTTNLLSFTWPDQRDVNLASLFQIVLALVHRAGGIPATVILKTAFVVGVFAVLWRVARARGAHPAVAGAILALAAWAAEPRFVERPHLVTFLGLALVLLALERGEREPWRGMWLFVVPGAALWANANSCLFEAPVVLLLYAVGGLIDARREPDADARRAKAAAARRAALLAAAMLPFVLATPSHVHALGYIANHFLMPSLRPLQEYRAVQWPLDGPFFFLAAAVAAVCLAAPRAIRWRALLPVVALGILGSRRVRFVAEFALLAGPAAAAAWTDILAGPRLRRLRVWLADARNLIPVGAAMGLVALAAAPRITAARAGGKWFDITMEAGLVPLGAITFLNENRLRDRMYNDLEVGSYLTWDGWPQHRVFQDPRINGYPTDFHALLRRRDLGKTEWDALLDRYGVQAALITYPSVNPRAGLFDPVRWAPVYRSADALIFVRRGPDAEAVLAANELPLTFSFADATGTMVHPVEAQPDYARIRRCEWNRRLADFFLERGDARKALKTYRTALASGLECIDPDNRQALMITVAGLQMRLSGPEDAVDLLAGLTDPVSRTNRGFALLQIKRASEALADFDGALALAPDNLEATFGRGVALSELGRRDEAIATFHRFLKAAPHDHMAAADAKARLDRLMTSR